MAKSRLSALMVVFLAGPLGAAEPKDKPTYETWDAVYLNGGKAGYVHTTMREVERDGQKLQRTTLVLDLTLKRFAETMHQRMEVGSDETPDGKVTGVAMRQLLAKEQSLVLTGTVEGRQLHVKVEGPFQIDRRVPWNEDALGLYRQQRLFRDRQIKPGDRFSYVTFEPQIMSLVTVHVSAGEEEEVEILPTKVKKRLLRVEATPDKIQGVQLPTLTAWLDKDRNVVRYEAEMPAFGTLVHIRTTAAAALAPPTAKADVGLRQLIRLNQRIPNGLDTEKVVYRITLKGDGDVATAFAQDDRQEVRKVQGNTFELHVRALREPEMKADPGKVGAEFVESNYFINSADARVKDLARRAVGREKDGWRKALLVEKWVHDHMKVQNYSEAMATADHVARTLEGDCTEYAMLTAAMCRAVDVPSRTAIGLVYLERGGRGGQPMFSFHMWTEVWVRGQWMPIDATLGRGYVGAAHVKITDHSWFNEQSLKPLIPLLRVLGKASIEVLSVDLPEEPVRRQGR
jgi:transglutaminase-like putative cysteine protease